MGKWSPLLLSLILLPLVALAEDTEPIKIGAIYAITGDWGSWGVNCQRGTDLAVAELEKKNVPYKLERIIEDSVGAKPVNAISAFRKLVDIDHVKFVLGPMSPEEYSAIAPLADSKGIPIIPFVSFRVAIPAAFFMWVDPDTEASRIADYVAERHRKVAILSSNQEWESIVGRKFKARLEEKGSEVPLIVEPPFDAVDVKTEIAKLKAQKFDSIFITSYLLFGKYIKGIQSSKIDVPLYSIEMDASSVALGGSGSEGLVFIRPASPDKEFRDLFHQAWGAEPDIPASQCYDSVMILNRAIMSGVRDKESFIKHFKAFQPYNGVSGRISVEGGRTIMSTDLFQVNNGAIVRLGPIPSGGR